jgi:hypothetical protein
MDECRSRAARREEWTTARRRARKKDGERDVGGADALSSSAPRPLPFWTSSVGPELATVPACAPRTVNTASGAFEEETQLSRCAPSLQHARRRQRRGLSRGRLVGLGRRGADVVGDLDGHGAVSRKGLVRVVAAIRHASGMGADCWAQRSIAAGSRDKPADRRSSDEAPPAHPGVAARKRVRREMKDGTGRLIAGFRNVAPARTDARATDHAAFVPALQGAPFVR